MRPWPRTGKPWSRVHVDFGEPLEAKSFFVIVYSYSVPSGCLSDLAGSDRGLCRILGPSETIASGNGTQFTFREFAEFCAQLNMVNVRMHAPYMPMNDGQAEKMVGTIKDSIDSHSATPTGALIDQSPKEVFFGRALSSLFDVFEPKSTSSGVSMSHQHRYNEDFDRHRGTQRFSAAEFREGEIHSFGCAIGWQKSPGNGVAL